MSKVTLTRAELYEQVWKTPMRTIAQQYGLSDVGLAKTCDRHEILRPPRGYWAQKQFGTAALPTPLSSCADPSLDLVELAETPAVEDSREAPAPPAAYDAEIQELLRLTEGLPQIVVPAALHSTHPLIERTKIHLAESKPDDDSMVVTRRYIDPPSVYVSVGKDNVGRALRFLDALFKAIGRAGGTVTVIRNYSRDPVTKVEFAGIEVATLRLREKYKQKRLPPDPTDKWQYRPIEKILSGCLVLGGGWPSDRPYCEDSDKTGKIETSINRLLIAWVHAAGRERIRLKREADERREQERQERARQAKAAERKLRRDDLLRRQKEEQAKVDRLIGDAESWHKAHRLRAFVTELTKTGCPPNLGLSASSFTDWLQWAREQVDRLDPLKASPRSILDEEFQE